MTGTAFFNNITKIQKEKQNYKTFGKRKATIHNNEWKRQIGAKIEWTQNISFQT